MLRLLDIIGPGPVSLAEVKAHCRIGHDAEDALLAVYIAAAQGEAEHRTGRVLVESDWEWILGAFPAGGAALELPQSPATEVLGVSYVDRDGKGQALRQEALEVVQAGLAYPVPLFGNVRPASEEWPDGTSVRIRFRAGWPLNDLNRPGVPAAIRQWLLLRVAGLYATRESHQDVRSAVQAAPRTFVDCLLDQWVIQGVA